MKKKQKGGDVIGSSLDLIRSMKSLGASIYTEIKAISQLSGDMNKATAPVSGTPNVVEGPPKFDAPKL
jgi:hypothetical protein